jgi:hypothetical protein
MHPPLNYFVDKPEMEKNSNSKKVQKNAKRYGLQVVYSPRKNKKYRFVNPETNKYIDFGFFGMSDFTKHNDKDRQKRFQIRNKRFTDAPKYSAGWASYFLLWT